MLSPAAQAFDAVAEQFDARFGNWLSVAAQRRAVRAALLRAFPAGARVIEIGGGTGEDALWLTRRGREVLLTDPSPAMVRIAYAKLQPHGGRPPIVAAAEQFETVVEECEGEAPFDGAFSNFAALNCVADLAPVARALARLLRPGAQVIVVVFGVCPPGEWLVQLARGDVRATFRRMTRGIVPARLGGHEFDVRYHRPADVARAFAPWFRPVARRGIGIFVPPSAAEPGISRYPRLVSSLERLDRVASRPLALLGDHVLYQFERGAATAAADVN